MKVFKGEIYWRILAGCASSMSILLSLANLNLVRQFLYQVDDYEDFLIVAIPTLWTVIASGASIAVAFLPAMQGIPQGVLRGTFIGAIAYLPLLWWMVFSIGGPGDGMAYWAGIFLPTFWLGIPLLFVGGLVGAKCGGARIPGLLLSVVVMVLLFKPGSLIATYLGKLIVNFAENVFIRVFA